MSAVRDHVVLRRAHNSRDEQSIAIVSQLTVSSLWFVQLPTAAEFASLVNRPQLVGLLFNDLQFLQSLQSVSLLGLNA